MNSKRILDKASLRRKTLVNFSHIKVTNGIVLICSSLSMGSKPNSRQYYCNDTMDKYFDEMSLASSMLERHFHIKGTTETFSVFQYESMGNWRRTSTSITNVLLPDWTRITPLQVVKRVLCLFYVHA